MTDRCSEEAADCVGHAWFSVRADGYPVPMFPRVCAAHVGAALADDLGAPGSTRRWIVEAL